MKNFRSILVGIIFILTTTNPQITSAQFFSYAKAFSATGAAHSEGIDVQVDNIGNTYCVGKYAGTVDFDPGPGVMYLTSAGWSDFYMAKLNANGDLIWVHSIGSIDDQLILGIKFDNFGNLVLYGVFKGTVDFDPGSNIFNLNSNLSYGLSAYIAKYDTAANFIWAKQISSPGFGSDVFPQSVNIDNNNDVIVLGTFKGNVDFDPGPSSIILSTIDANAFILKLDNSGSFIWAKKFGNISSSIGFSSSVYDNFNSIYATGNYKGSTDFDPDSNLYFMNSGSQFVSGFVLKLTIDGNFVWSKTIGSSGNNDNIGGIAIDPGLTGIYLAGNFQDSVIFDSISTQILVASGSYDNFLLKLDTAGNFDWVRSFGNATYDRLNRVTADINGVYASGKFSDTLDFYSSFGGSLVSTSTYRNSIVCKFNHNGDPQWIYTFANLTGEVDITGIAIDNIGEIHTTGWFETATDFDPGPSSYNLVSPGGHNIFIHKTGQLSTGSVDADLISQVVFYPNPAQSELNIELDSEYSNIILNMYNGMGQKIHQSLYKDRKYIRIDLFETPGLYNIEIISPSKHLGVFKIIIRQ